MSNWERREINNLIAESPEEYKKRFPKPFSSMIPDDAGPDNKLATEAYVNAHSGGGGGGGQGNDPNAVHFTQQSLTEEQKEQARTNIGAGTYSKPQTGIPASDMAVGVIPDAVEANPTVPSGTTPSDLTGLKVGSDYYQIKSGKSSVGLFPTASALNAEIPSPNVGDYAFVGYGFPADIYVCQTAGTWVDSGEDYDGDNVDLTNYATQEEVSQLESEVDALMDAFSEPSGGEDVDVDGFADFSGNGYTNTQFVQVFKPVFDNDVPITKLKIRVNQKTENGYFSVKLASAKAESNNSVVTTDVSDAIVVTPGLPVGTIGDVIVPISTPFTVKQGERFALAVSEKDWLRLGNHDLEDGTLCAVTTYYTNIDFSTFVTGVRIASNIIYLNFDNQKLFVLPYTGGGGGGDIEIKDIPTREEMNDAIQDAKDEIKETTDALSDSVSEIDDVIHGILTNLKESIVVSKYTTELMAHCSNIRDGGNGYFYVCYYASDTDDHESIGNNILCRLARVSQYDLHDVTVIDVLKRGDAVGTFTQSATYAPYDPNILIFGTTIRYFMSVTEGTTPGIGYRDIAISDLSLGNSITWCKIKYTINGITYNEDATHANLGKMIDRYFGQSSGGTIGLFPIFSAPFVSANGIIYGYLTGLDAGHDPTSKDWAGTLVKSEDNGLTWEVIAWANDLFTPRVDFPVWEAALSLLDEKMYILFKSVDTPIAYYDFNTSAWSNLVYLFGYNGQGPYIDNSRPGLCQVNGKLYAMQNVLPRLVTSYGEVYRGKVGIYRLTPGTMAKEDYFELVNDTGCQYFSVINQKGRLYMCFTEDKSHRNYQMKGDISIIPIDFLPMPE